LGGVFELILDGLQIVDRAVIAAERSGDGAREQRNDAL